MANSVDFRRRTKCSVRNGFQCGVLVLYAAACLGLGGSGVAADRDFVKMSVTKTSDCVRHGEDLEILCTAGGSLRATDLYFTLNDDQLPSTIVNSTTIRLFIEKPAEHSRQVYYCKSRTNKITYVVVCIASPPAEVEDFKCISRNIEMLNCSWTSPDKTIFTNYNLTFYTNGSPVKPCIASVVPGTRRRYCYWNTTSVPRYKEQEEKYFFTLSANNTFDTKKQNFSVDHFSVVKPDPPLHLKNISKTAHSVLLQWNLPIKIVDFLPDGVETKIEYQIAKIDDTSFFHRVDTSSLPPTNKTYRFNLSNLPYAHMKYGVRVYIKPNRAKSDEFWSDFSNIVFYTASEKPKRPPDITAGAFTQNIFEGYRLMYVYWKQLEEYEEAGANFTYKVVVYQNSRVDTFRPDKDKSLGFLYLDNATLDEMEVYIWAINEKGQSINSSYLYIPPERETRSLSLSSFTKLAFENGTYELSWVGTHKIDNYTLFWCHHNVTNICTGRVNFTVLEPEKNKHIIDLPRDYRYQFAISANNGTQTSGMVWANCDISKDGIAMYGFPIRFTDHDAPGKTFVKLKWSMDCTLKDDTIKGYIITYCPVIRTSTTCDVTSGNISSSRIHNPKQMEINITDLQPYKTYQFTMALNTRYGLKTIENATVYITTLEDTPTIPRNVNISDITNESLLVSWDPPLHLNGHISKIKYVIYNFGEKFREIRYEDNKSYSNKSRNRLVLSGLNGFTNYSLTMRACNEGIHSCSDPTKVILLRTAIGRPSKMNPPQFDNNLLTWTPPLIAGGTVDQYQIRIVKNEYVQILNTTDLMYPVTSCEGAVKNETYQVRAVNFDTDLNHGALAGTENVALPLRSDEDLLIYPGEWSEESLVMCRSRDNLLLLFIGMAVLCMIGLGWGSLKGYNKLRKMCDIEPQFPPQLFVPEKQISKFALYPSSEKEEKPPKSDEMLLLPNTKAPVPPSETRQSDSHNCGSSDHTDSTALSDTSQGPIDRQNSTSDDDSHSSLHIEIDAAKTGEEIASNEESESSNTDSDGSKENSPYFSNNAFKKNETTGYVQPQPLVEPVTGGYVQSAPMSLKAPQKPPTPLASSSYVMAGLPVSAFPSTTSRTPASGYVRADEAQPRPMMLYPKLGTSPTMFGSESLPTPTLPLPKSEDSHIQLQSLDAFPSQKPSVRHTMSMKAPGSSGYVTAMELGKHMTPCTSPAHDEAAILDPAMSPDAYCRFSWSTDPANDNLHSLLATSPTINSNKNPVNH